MLCVALVFHKKSKEYYTDISCLGGVFVKNTSRETINTFIWHLKSIKCYEIQNVVWTGNNHLCFPTVVFSFKDITMLFTVVGPNTQNILVDCVLMLSSPHLIRQLSPNAIPLIRPDFRCTEIVKYYLFNPLKRDLSSCKATFPLEEGRGCCGLDRMVVGFITTCAISDLR